MIHYPDGSDILFTQDTVHPNRWLPPPAVGQRLFQNGTIFTLQLSNGFRYRFEQLTDVVVTRFFNSRIFWTANKTFSH